MTLKESFPADAAAGDVDGAAPADDGDGAARAAARAFLASHGLSLEALAREVPEGGPDQIVLLVGSIPCGLANALSDIDLLVIGSRNRSGSLVIAERGLQQIVYRLPNGLEVNTAFYDDRTLGEHRAALLATLGGGVERSWEEEAGVATLDPATLKLAHRLRTGIALRGDPGPLRAELSLDRLADYLVLNGRMEHFVFREDAVAQMHGGHMRSAVHHMLLALGHLATMVLASIGETNPDPKWRMRLLERHAGRIATGPAEQLAEQLADLLLGPGAGDAQAWLDRAGQLADRLLGFALEQRPYLALLTGMLDERIRFDLSGGPRTAATGPAPP